MCDACVRDAFLAPTWFDILFYGSISDNDLGILQKKGNKDILAELSGGHPADDSMLTNKRDRCYLDRHRAKFRQKELFVDMLLHIAIHSHYHGQCPLERSWRISSMLKKMV